MKIVSMKLVAECQLYAEEYRKLAATMSKPEEKQALETMDSSPKSIERFQQPHRGFAT
jgi:hypothetical protein